MNSNTEMPKKENYFQCKWCLRKFDKFEGYEKFENIKQYTSSVMAGLWKAKDKPEYKDTEFFKHLELFDVGRRMYCPKAYDPEYAISFKHRTQYYRHREKHYKGIEPQIDDNKEGKKELVKNFVNKLNRLCASGYTPKELEWSLDPIPDSEDEDFSPEPNMNIEIKEV